MSKITQWFYHFLYYMAVLKNRELILPAVLEAAFNSRLFFSWRSRKSLHVKFIGNSILYADKKYEERLLKIEGNQVILIF